MTRWDEYQWVTTAAKQAGGVPELLKSVEAGAVAKAAPRIFTKGFGAGAVGAVVVVLGVQHYLERRETKIAEAEASKAVLVAKTSGDPTQPAGQSDAAGGLPPSVDL